MTKSPVSLLQEAMFKRGNVPAYEEIPCTKNTHNNTFKMRVTCEGFFAIGEATTKKQAKLDAATKMLKVLQSKDLIPECSTPPTQLPPDKPNDSLAPSVNPEIRLSSLRSTGDSGSINSSGSSDSLPTSKSVPAQNYVGMLNELCASKRWTMPVYGEVRMSGPPHMRKFMVKCTVDSTCANGTCSTKKMAKQDAAKKVLVILKALNNSGDPSGDEESENLPNIKAEVVMDLYRLLTQART